MKFKSPLCIAAALIIIGETEVRAAVIFTETFGSIPSTTSLASHNSNSGFDNDGYTFSGSVDVRSSMSSTVYTGASGGANVYFTNSGNPTFTIAGISTIGYSPGTVAISFGAFKTATASDMTDVTFEYSSNGTTWTTIALPAQPTGSGTSSWRLISLSSAAIPITSTLSLRWTSTSVSSNYRIDDVVLTANAIPEPAALSLVMLGFSGLLRRRRKL